MRVGATHSATLLTSMLSGDSVPLQIQYQTDLLHHVDAPMCSAIQHGQCQDPQYHAPKQWSDTVLLESLLSHDHFPSTAASHPSYVGPATAAAACTAALAEILDSFGGPNISDGWGRLALGCCSPHAAFSSSSACCSSANSHQTTAEGLQHIGQHTKQAWGDLLPDQFDAPHNTSINASGHAHHAAQLASLDNSSLPVFNQPPSYRLPSDLPIWSLDIPPSAAAQLIDWCDTAVPACMQDAHAQKLHSSHWHHHNQAMPLPLPLPLPLMSHMPELNLQLATQPAAAAAARATVSAAAAEHVGTDTTDAAKPKKKKGI